MGWRELEESGFDLQKRTRTGTKAKKSNGEIEGC